jgi:sulfonate transport system ATP-binding protein
MGSQLRGMHLQLEELTKSFGTKIENGKIGMNVEINLPRPRPRGDAEFAQTVEKILQRVMGKQERDRLYKYALTSEVA